MSSSGDAPPGAIARWLSIVGIGEDGLEGLGAGARKALGDAELVFGGRRHIDLAAGAITGEVRVWSSPFDPSMAEVMASRGRRVCVLASGDPFLHGVGATLARHVPPAEFEAYPTSSAFSLAAAKLGWALHDVIAISFHGHDVRALRPSLQDHARIIALTSDGDGPSAIAGLMAELGFGGSIVHVLEALGGPAEQVHSMAASAFGGRRFAALNVVAIEVVATADAPVIPLGGAVPDVFFENDGQITKQEIRALVLAGLAPRRGEVLWDIGAGSGSISISWMLTDPSLRAFAIERNPERARRIRRNADALGVPALRVVEGDASVVLDGLPVPDAIFIGGGGSRDAVIEIAIAMLRPGGRLVANAVTLEMEAVLGERYRRHGGRLTRIAVSRAGEIGDMKGWRPAMPVTQWIWRKEA